LEKRQLLTTFIVTSDGSDASPGTLGWAIRQADSDPEPSSTILFAIGSGAKTISLNSSDGPFPAITHPVTIDATTQPGYVGTPLITLQDGESNLNITGLDIQASKCVVEGLRFQNFSLSAAIQIEGTGNVVKNNIFENNNEGVLLWDQATNNTIGGTDAGAGNLFSNNFIGIHISAFTANPPAPAFGNYIQGNQIDTNANDTTHIGRNVGVLIDQGANKNTIGGSQSRGGNVISDILGSGRPGIGVEILDTGTTGNNVLGNMIGTDVGGTAALGNYDGVVIGAGASNNTIGATESGFGNVISGNLDDGISISTTGTTGNNLFGNKIGTTAAGTGLLANGANGVHISSGASGNNIGGTEPGAGNLISGNGAAGILIAGPGTEGNQVVYNRIGTTDNTTVPLGNKLGVVIYTGASKNIIGPGNVISGNSAGGIQISYVGASGNQVVNNKIGTDASGTVALGNGRQPFDGSGTGDGVLIEQAASNNFVTGNLISGQEVNGVHITGSGTTQNQVQGNEIGTNPTCSAALPNNADGVLIDQGASGNLVGGPDPSSRNDISGNGGDGIALSSAGTTGNQVQGNWIGTDGTGFTAMPNGGNGIGIYGASDNFIGATALGAGNVISGNTGAGVYITGTSASGNQVLRNRIGTSRNGMVAVGNSSGVVIDAGANSNIIGEIGGASSNLISGNSNYGVEISGAGTSKNAVTRNQIGTNADGTAALGNQNYGVLLYMGASSNNIGDPVQSNAGNQIGGNAFGVVITGGAHDNTVGGVASGAGNLISANAEIGVWVIGSGTTGNTVEGNRIGTDATGLVAAPNWQGVLIEGGASSNTIGGTAAGAGNVIAFNHAAGVVVGESDSVGNAIRQNSIFSNGALGIDLGGDGVTPNTPRGPHTGPNNLQNYPTLSAPVSPLSGTGFGPWTLPFTLNSTPNTNNFTVEFFANATPDPSGHGQGQTFLGSMLVNTDQGGNHTDSFSYSPVPGQPFITATATDPAGNTSEFSAAVAPTPLQMVEGVLQIGLNAAQNFLLQRDSVRPQLLDLVFTGGAASTVSIDPAALPQITVNAAAGDVVNIEDVPAGVTLSVNGGTSTTVVNLSPGAQNLDTIQGTVVVKGSGTVNVDDQAGPPTNSYTLTASALSRPNFGGLAYSGISALTVNAAADNNNLSPQNIYVLATPAGTATTINAANGWHNIVIGLPSSNALGLPASPLEKVQGPVSVSGQGYQDTVDLYDSGSTAQKTYTLNETNIQVTPAGGVPTTPVSWQGTLGYLVLFGSSYVAPSASATSDTYLVKCHASNLADLVVYGAWTTNTFQSLLPEQHTWLVYSNQGVTTAGTPGHYLILGAVWNLTGGPAGDTFQFQHANGADGRVKGVLDGGGPGAWLDYSQNVNPVTVNLTPGTGSPPPGQPATGLATGVAGGVRNIQNVIGSLMANNTLTGNTQSLVSGILIGGNGHDLLTAGLGRSILVAEGGTSTLIGGGADDILIGGYTDYDHRQTALQAVNEAAWMAILAEWQRTDRTYSQRLHDLRVGGAGTLNGTATLIWGLHGTVHDSGAADVLQGDATGMAGDLDWFFVGQHDRFAVPAERGEHTNNN
jgi:hypothetical protein